MTRDTYDMFDPPDRGRFGDNESAPADIRDRGDRLVILHLALHYETPERGANPGAIRVSRDGDDSVAEWIPKSRCESIDRHNTFITGRRKDGSAVGCKSVTVTMSERLAKEKGLA